MRLLKTFLFLILAFLAACTYTFRNTRLEGVRTLHIRPVENKTIKYELGDLLYRYLNDSCINDGNLSPESEGDADSILDVKVKEYRKETGSIDSAGNPTSVKITIRLDYTFSQGEKVVESDDDYNFEAFYEYDISVSDSVLVERTAKALASDLRDTIMEGF
ncbi:MAG TPA: LPS assembly lipoprotein LptE [Candidatus Mcinerneyibacteriales bacterium]|nr:LPS assembly lipoprotein LptE [Candidatus Mcinerneyibacteriales bacterium]